MKVSVAELAKHLSIMRIGGRVKEIKFDSNFSADLCDANDEVACRGLLDCGFDEPFAVSDLQSLLKVVSTFEGEVDVKVKKDKLVLKSGGVTVQHQLADPDLILTAFLNFDEILETAAAKSKQDLNLDEDMVKRILSYTKLISPKLASFKVEKDKLVLELKSMTGHKVVIDLQTKTKKKGTLLSLSALALTDVIGGLQKTGELIYVDICNEALKLTSDEYTFMIEPETVTSVDDEGEV